MRILLISLGVIAGLWVAVLAGLLIAGRPRLAKQVASFLPNLLLLFTGLAKDPQVPRRAKILLAIGALWIASPIDLIPEFIPVLGPLDDAIMAVVVLRYVMRSVDPVVVARHWRGDAGGLDLLLRLAGRGVR